MAFAPLWFLDGPLPRLRAYPRAELPRPKIVICGTPLRGIAPCGSCQGSLDNRPLLESQSEIHMKEQLQAFASEQRRNDISQQMRNIARAMTPRDRGGGGVLRLTARPIS